MASRAGMPDPIRRFILTRIPSVPFLEAMLLLRAQPQQAWDPATVARRLYIPAQEAGEILRQLQDAGIAAAQPGPGEGSTWSYAPSPELAPLLDEVAALYARDLVGVTQLVHSRHERRARQFADAFRFRKEN